MFIVPKPLFSLISARISLRLSGVAIKVKRTLYSMEGFQNKVDKTPNQITARKSSCLNLSVKVDSYILYQ